MGDVHDYQMLIDGAWVGSASGKTFQSIDPATGEVWCRVPEATAEHVDRAVRAATLHRDDGGVEGGQAIAMSGVHLLDEGTEVTEMKESDETRQ